MRFTRWLTTSAGRIFLFQLRGLRRWSYLGTQASNLLILLKAKREQKTKQPGGLRTQGLFASVYPQPKNQSKKLRAFWSAPRTSTLTARRAAQSSTVGTCADSIWRSKFPGHRLNL